MVGAGQADFLEDTDGEVTVIAKMNLQAIIQVGQTTTQLEMKSMTRSCKHLIDYIRT